MPDYEEIIKQSQANVKFLSEKLKDLDKLYQEIKMLKAAAEGIPIIFNQKFQELVKLSEDYTNTLGASTKKYLDGNNTLFTTKFSELSTKIKEFEKEIERLEKIDLEKNFDKLQKTLSEIFGAINAINLTLTNIVQTLTGIVQTLGNIQTTIDTNHKEAKQLLNSFSEATEKHLTDQDKRAAKNGELLGTIQTTLDTNHKEAKQLLTTFNEATEKHLTDQDKQAAKNVELLESKIKSLSEQNELLRKEVKTNRIIQIVGFAVIIIILIYVIVK